MLYMCELREENVTILKSLGKNCNCIEGNFLEYTTSKFDYIIGNPPYNVMVSKVPTNNTKQKTRW